MIEDFIRELHPRQLDAALLAGVRALFGVDLLLQGAVELGAGKGGPLPCHRLEHAPGIARGDRLAQFVHVLAALELNAAMRAFVLERPFREGAVALGEVVGVAGIGVDFRRHDVNVRVVLVIMGDKEGPGVAHPERFQGGLRGPFHLLAARRFPTHPGQRQVHAILLALLGAAFLIERVEFHHAPREIRVGRVHDVETEACAAHPCNAALLAGYECFQLAGFVIAAFAEDIAHGAGDTLAGLEPRCHSTSKRSQIEHAADRELVHVDAVLIVLQRIA